MEHSLSAASGRCKGRRRLARVLLASCLASRRRCSPCRLPGPGGCVTPGAVAIYAS